MISDLRLTSYGKLVKLSRTFDKRLPKLLATDKDMREHFMPLIMKQREGGFMNVSGLSKTYLRRIHN